MNKFLIILLSLLFFTSCKNRKLHSKISLPKNFINNISVKKEFSKENKNWYLKDILQDSIIGISLERANNYLSKNKKGKEVIVAVIDTEIDINHIELKDKIWVNKDEISGNGIDDDKNGYVDDVNGWNFIGNFNGENIIYSSLESIRIIQYYNDEFKNKKRQEIPLKKREEFDLYKKALRDYKEKLKIAKADVEYGSFLFYGYPKAKKAMKNLFPQENYSLKELDSIYKKYKTTNKELSKHAYFISDFIKYNLTEEWINNYKTNAENKINTIYNLEYFDRIDIDNKPNDVTYTNYGCPFVNQNIDTFYHGTLIAGLIAAIPENSKDIERTSNFIKIMPLAISSNGDEHDKDIALAIKYAVDNGAKVINMSFGKDLSLHEKWIFDAIKYAEDNNVLVVSSAGNSGMNLNYNNYYPNDNIDKKNELSNNFVLVGSSSFQLNKKLLSFFSNYGNLDVDLFAPGEKIYTTLPNNKYKFDNGTSLSSAITSKVASILYSYYPNLSASEIKHILMESGLEFSIEVSTPTKEDENKTTPFNQLSKSGKILNAYNALIMADSISKRLY